MPWQVKRGETIIVESVEVTALREWASKGNLAPDDYVFNPILNQWMYAKDAAELSGVFRRRSHFGCGLAIAMLLLAVMFGSWSFPVLPWLCLLGFVVAFIIAIVELARDGPNVLTATALHISSAPGVMPTSGAVTSDTGSEANGPDVEADPKPPAASTKRETTIIVGAILGVIIVGIILIAAALNHRRPPDPPTVTMPDSVPDTSTVPDTPTTIETTATVAQPSSTSIPVPPAPVQTVAPPKAFDGPDGAVRRVRAESGVYGDQAEGLYYRMDCDHPPHAVLMTKTVAIMNHYRPAPACYSQTPAAPITSSP
jgi:hypothetical protein